MVRFSLYRGAPFRDYQLITERDHYPTINMCSSINIINLEPNQDSCIKQLTQNEELAFKKGAPFQGLPDAIVFKSIKFNNNDYSLLSNSTLQIKSMGNIIFKINFKLLLKISDVIKHKKFTIININPNLLFMDDSIFIPLIAMQYSDLYISTTIKTQIIIQNYCYQPRIRRMSAIRLHKYMINKYDFARFNSNVIDINNINGKDLLLGFFINTTKINNIKLKLNNEIVFDYNHDIIKQIGYVKKKKPLYKLDVLKETLPLPDEICEIVYGKVKKTYKYFYWIPITPYALHYNQKIPDSYINTGRFQSCSLHFDTIYKGSVNILTFGDVTISGGIINVTNYIYV